MLEPARQHQPIMRQRTLAILIIALLVIVGPLFVCMPLNSDTALFDVQADRVLQDGVLYRDIIEPNLPGVVWVHLAIRSVLGWSSEAMRFADLLIFGGVLLLAGKTLTLARPVRLSSADASLTNELNGGRATTTNEAIKGQRRITTFTAFALFFYLSCNEWCHAQRDTWMLLPAMAAVWLRLKRNHGSASFGVDTSLSLLEGVCWGAAFWIKPHVAIPALCVIAVDLFSRRRSGVFLETAMVIAGGMLVGLPGIAWMTYSGAWPHFWDMMLEWNPEYLKAGRERQSVERWVLMFRRFYPWWLVHLVALPVAIARLRNVLRRRLAAHEHAGGAVEGHLAGISAFYVGWLLQSLALQHAMDYIHVPAIVLGLLVIASHEWNLAISIRKPVIAAFLLLAMLASPILRPERLSKWTACVKEGSSPALKAKLAHGTFPNWNELHDVAEFLRDQNVNDYELTCLNVHSVHLFRELDVQPATRYWCVKILQELFPSRSSQIEGAVKSSDGRFIVTESMETGLTGATALPTSYPWNLPVVFESGTYRVHAVTRPADAQAAAMGDSIRSF
ncbi:hypothetical protein [Fuerstiella marisgermanici]|nr:hypothetical protein [Fuerstiella marisgermanici]